MPNEDNFNEENFKWKNRRDPLTGKKIPDLWEKKGEINGEEVWLTEAEWKTYKAQTASQTAPQTPAQPAPAPPPAAQPAPPPPPPPPAQPAPVAPPSPRPSAIREMQEALLRQKFAAGHPLSGLTSVPTSPMGPAPSTDYDKNIILPILLAYFKALDEVTEEDNPESYKVRTKLKETIKKINPEHDFIENRSASPTTVVGGSGVSRSEIEKPTTLAEHLELLTALDGKLEEILRQPHKMSPDVFHSLRELRGVVQASISKVEEQMHSHPTFGP